MLPLPLQLTRFPSILPSKTVRHGPFATPSGRVRAWRHTRFTYLEPSDCPWVGGTPGDTSPYHPVWLAADQSPHLIVGLIYAAAVSTPSAACLFSLQHHDSSPTLNKKVDLVLKHAEHQASCPLTRPRHSSQDIPSPSSRPTACTYIRTHPIIPRHIHDQFSCQHHATRST